MKIKTHSTKRYIISDEDENILRRAAKLFDELYDCSEEHGEYESDFERARDDIDYLIDQWKQDDMETFWEENYTSIDEP